jgi:hypothetical protein
MEQNGASLDQIYQRVLDRLLQTNSLNHAKKNGYLRLDRFIEDEEFFVYEPETALYFTKKQSEEHTDYTKEYFKYKDELRISLTELLTVNRIMTLDDIYKEIFEIFNKDKHFPIRRDLYDLLNEIAIKSKLTGKWRLKPITDQPALDFGETFSQKLLKVRPDKNPPGEMIFRMLHMGKYLGFQTWIGKKEQSSESFMGYKFSDISIPLFPLSAIDKIHADKIRQIDVIWFDRENIPRYAFEIEETTNILTAFERFVSLLEIQYDIANKLFIIAPKSRKKKLSDVFKTSSYIGHPLYLENKIRFIFKEDLIKFYDQHLEKIFTTNDLKILYDSIAE